MTFPESDDAICIENAGICIENAGLTLFGLYLPALFDRLGLLKNGDDGPRLMEAGASRAVYMLQYLVDGHCNRPAAKNRPQRIS